MKTPIHLRAPLVGAPVLDHWRGVYDHVFVVLNPPFCIPWTGGLPERFRIRSSAQDWVSAHHDVWFVDETDDCHTDLDKLIREHAIASTWAAEHARLCPDVPWADFVLSYWLAAVIGYVEEVDPRVRSALEADTPTCWFLPDENELPQVQAPAIGAFFAALGCTEVSAWSEFRDSIPKTFKPADFQNPETELMVESDTAPWRIGALHAADPGVLMSWAFDETWATLAMTDAAYARARPDDHFECIRATPAMHPDWPRQL
ncbi:MAG: hypothetical protein AAGM84_00280 [Pseudomonadota bacterium]